MKIIPQKLHDSKVVAGFGVRLYFKDDGNYTSILEVSRQADGGEVVVTETIRDYDAEHANGMGTFEMINTKENLQEFFRYHSKSVVINLE